MKIIELRKPLKVFDYNKFFVQTSGVFKTHKIPLIDSDTGVVKHIIDILRNLASRLQVDELTRETESKYLKLFEFLPIGVLLAQEPDLMVLETNNAFLQILEL